MFSGVNKSGGQVVGGVIRGNDANVALITMGESAESASAEEILIGHSSCTADGSSREVFMRSRVSVWGGGLAWLPAKASDAARDTTCMSQMTSMLNDHDRNTKYERAISKVVQDFIRRERRPPVVLDIGCGTGLLSMIASKAGASEVYACEMHEPLADIARGVTELNCGGGVKVMAKKSTDLLVGEQGDLPTRADICVNEVYDSALLGEGCLPSFRHALGHLLVSEAVMVPRGARVYGMLLSSPSIRARHDLSTAEFCAGVPVARNDRAAKCDGGRKLLPLQRWEVGDAHELSPEFEVLEFNFGRPFPVDGCRSRVVPIRVTSDGVLDAVRMTWDLLLDEDNTYSTRPGSENWQDHWTPTYYPITGGERVKAGDVVHVKATHDELHTMFEVMGVDRANVDKNNQGAETEENTSGEDKTNPKRRRPRKNPTIDVEGYTIEREWDPEPCACGWHVLCSPERIGMLTDVSRRNTYHGAIKRALEKTADSVVSTVCLDIGDGSTCTFLATELGVSTIVTYEPKDWSNLLVEQVVRNNDLETKVHILDSADDWPFLKVEKEGMSTVDEGEKQDDPPKQERLLCDILMGEPYYYQMQTLVTYQAMNFWYTRKVFDPVLQPHARTMPMRAIVCAACVELPQLKLSHGPVGSVLGFDHQPYDDIVDGRWHELLYPYLLRAYEHRILGAASDLLVMDYSSLPMDVESMATLDAHEEGTVHAIALWIDYQLDESSRWSTFGRASQPGNKYDKQLLRFLRQPISVTREEALQPKITIRGHFDAAEAQLSFDVSQ